MKKLLLSIIFISITLFGFSQSPEKMSYQSVIRDENNALLVNQPIGMRVSILQGEIEGTSVYSETHTVNTNGNGLASLEIGGGTVLSGVLADIDWASGPYYILTEVDINGGTNYTITSTSQLMSVPYALYAKNAGSTPQSPGTFQHYIGEYFGGGVIFHLWKDVAGVEHGLIVDVVDTSISYAWSNIEDVAVGGAASSSWDGENASLVIVNQENHIYSAASICLNAVSNEFDDWYLPSIDELIKIWYNRIDVNKTLNSISGATQIPIIANYWSSTESFDNFAWSFNFANGSAFDNFKGTPLAVRAIRQF